MPTTLLLSIRPEHANRIFSGEKTMELRRIRPRVCEGDEVIVYVTVPRKEIVGTFTVIDLIDASPDALWPSASLRACLSREAFDHYFDGAGSAYGICVGGTKLLARPKPLAEIKALLPGFHPPQSYKYLNKQERDLMTGVRHPAAA